MPSGCVPFPLGSFDTGSLCQGSSELASCSGSLEFVALASGLSVAPREKSPNEESPSKS